ncbi:hypothetical protein [uncultured Algibacter sp.]|uniref:WD40/YVTN/BNR-like repeat-containing protein n=1 Tax=uncultured Algibacter sp. TaxID=298659 RepID=UPI002630C98E|nr:hypothetical protein [uncultured Algibacter sp.]
MKNTFFLIICALSFAAFGQELAMDLLANMKPRNIGPAGMSGRVTSIDVVLSNPDIIYAGTASGGLWKSSSGGIKWEPIFENEVTASIGAVAIQQSNPSVIWVGTGEGNPRNSLNGGYGIYRSLDAGKTWKLMGLEKTRHIHRVIIDPTNPNVVYVAAIGSPWGEHMERGVYKTTDGGQTWVKTLFSNEKTGAADLVMDPTNPNKLIAAMWEHKREPWFFKSGGKGSGLHITYDGGENWKKVTEKDGFPKGDLGRIGIAIAKNKPDVIYALVEAKKNALYKSEDGGFKWKKINDKKDKGDRPFYYSEIYVDPQNENRVYSIFTYVNVSEDGGKNFTKLMPAYNTNRGVHADHHAWWIHPNNGNFMIDGNDGGLNITKDGGKSWRFIGNLPVAQFYHINIDNDIPYNVYGGMQDNGSHKGPAYVWKYQGIRNSYWQEISFGDGFDVIPDKANSRFGWSMSQQGSVYYYDSKTGNNFKVKPTHPNPNVLLRFNWNAAINIDPFSNNTLYFGSQFVHKSTDKGLTWKIISDDLTTNAPNKLNQANSGGLTIDATGAENHCTILVIEPSPLEKDMLWVSTDDGKVHITQNGGESWKDISGNIKGLPKGSWIPQIKASNKNKGEALLIANDYRRFNYEPYAYKTTDYGKTWKRIVDASDVKSYTLSIIEDRENSNLLFLGTDDGLYVSVNAGDAWKKWTEGFPTVSVKDLIIHPREDDLIIGTFGRSAWILDDIRPLRAIAKNASILNDSLTLFEPPVAYLAAYQRPYSRFGADATYNGENRERYARISYYLNIQEHKPESDSTNSTIKDSLTLKIYDGSRLIRTLKTETPKKSGIHKLNWDLTEKGPDKTSRKESFSNKENSGIKVKPGIYQLVINYGTIQSKNNITVKSDPRIENSTQVIDKTFAELKELENMEQLMADAVMQLNESKSIAQNYKTKLTQLNKEKYDLAIKSSEEIVNSINQIIDMFLGKEDKRQGIVRSSIPNVKTRLSLAKTYIESRPKGSTTTEKTLTSQGKAALKDALNKTNIFFENNWKTYKKDMEFISLSPFKETRRFIIGQ